MTELPHYPIKPLIQLVYLILVCIGCAVIGVVISIAIIAGLYGTDVLSELATISASSPPDVINAYKIMIAVGNTMFIFLVPALFFGYLIVREPEEYLQTNFRFSWILIPIVLVIMFATNPVMEMLININAKLALPDALKGIEQWMKDAESEAQRIINIVLKSDSIADLLVSLLIVAILPAIAEEFLFRGCLQTIFKRWTGNIHAAVWITAILFSAFHMQFFGFLPRVLLGVLFGYMVAWSGSIWPAVWAHFVNNGTAVIVTYLYQTKKIKLNPDDQHIFNYTQYIISLIFVLFLLWVYKNIASGKKHLPGY